MISPLRKSPLKRSGKPLKRTRIKKKARPKSETLRIYGPPARRAWMKTLPCSACGVVGYSEGAHVLGNGGTGRKADYDTQAPLCGPHWIDNNSFLDIGCHAMYDEHRSEFNACYPGYDPEKVAADCERLWLERSREAVGSDE